jgi:hypothetical protein
MPPMSSSKAQESRMMAMLLSERLKEANVGGNFSVDSLEKDIKHQHVQALGKDQNWDRIDKEFSLTINGESRRFTSTLTPQSQITNGAFGPEPGTGVCCHDGESTDPVNLWQSELKDEDGNVMFRQIRTGVNCAYEITDPDERKEANDSRLRQLVMVAIGSDPKLQEQARDQLDPNKQPKAPIVVQNLWISHLTPDVIRGTGIKGQQENERMMALEQYQAMQDLKNLGETEITVPGQDGQEIKLLVKYEPIMFNFGVNAGAVAFGGSDLTGGWSFSNENFNEPSMELLMGRPAMEGGEMGGWVGQALETNRAKITQAEEEIARLKAQQDRELLGELPTGQDVQEQDDDVLDVEERLGELQQIITEARASNERIEALSKQVQDLWVSGEYMTQGEDPYKMSSRLGVLGFELGSVVTSNCKSNKDRNSYGDVHMKDLSIQMREKGELRAPNQPRSREEQINLRTIGRQCGNSELQTLNVGGAGYKLEGVEQVYLEQGLLNNDSGFMGYGGYTAT